MKKDLIDYLETRIVYYKNQNDMIDNQDAIFAADWAWKSKNNAMIARLETWIEWLHTLGEE